MFDGLKRRGAHLQKLRAPALDFGIELLLGDDGIDEAPFEHLRGTVPAAHHPDLARALVADDSSEMGNRISACRRGNAGTILTENRVLGCDGQVAAVSQMIASGYRIAV